MTEHAPKALWRGDKSGYKADPPHDRSLRSSCAAPQLLNLSVTADDFAAATAGLGCTLIDQGPLYKPNNND